MKEKKRPLISEGTEEQKLYLTSIYQKHYERLFLYAARFVSREADAEDITQNVYLKLLTHPEGFDSEEGIKAFLFTMTRRACIDFLRHEQVIRRNEAPLAERWDTTQTEMEKERTSVALAAFRRLRSLIDDLPEDKRAIATRALLEGRTNQEVADLLGEKYHKIRYIRDLLINKLKLFFKKD